MDEDKLIIVFYRYFGILNTTKLTLFEGKL